MVHGKCLVEVIIDEKELDARCAPPMPSEVTPLQQLAKSVSPLVGFSVMEIIFNYCYVMRLYNGEVEYDLSSSISLLLGLCPCLWSITPLKSAREVLTRCLEMISKSQASDSIALTYHCLAIAKDAALIMSQPNFFVASTVSHGLSVAGVL